MVGGGGIKMRLGKKGEATMNCEVLNSWRIKKNDGITHSLSLPSENILTTTINKSTQLVSYYKKNIQKSPDKMILSFMCWVKVRI